MASGDVLILIPARMASTRLPGKPLADIGGVPMIVHVMRRAQEAARRAGRGRDRLLRDRGRGRMPPEVRRRMTRSDHVSGSDRIYEALGNVDPRRPLRDRRQRAGRLADPGARGHPRRARPARRPAGRHRDDRGRDPHEASERTDPNVVKVVGSAVAPGRLRALYFTRATAPYGEGPLYHHIGLYAYRRAALEHFVALPPSPLEQRERLEQLRALEAGMRIDVGDRRHRCRSGSTRPRIWSGRARCSQAGVDLTVPSRVTDAHEQSQEDRVPGRARREFAHRLPRRAIRTTSRSRARPSRMRCAALSAGEADLGMIPIDNSIAGRVADIHHLLPHANLHIVGEYFLPIHFQLMAAEGRDASPPSRRWRATSTRSASAGSFIRKHGFKAVVAADTAGAARHIAEAGDVTRARARAAARRRHLRPRCTRRQRRGRGAQHDALRHPVARRTVGAERQRPDGHDVHLPRAQRAGRALQGDGRLCHQRRQHDQARELHARGQFLRHHVLCRRRRATPKTAGWPSRSTS